MPAQLRYAPRIAFPITNRRALTVAPTATVFHGRVTFGTKRKMRANKNALAPSEMKKFNTSRISIGAGARLPNMLWTAVTVAEATIDIAMNRPTAATNTNARTLSRRMRRHPVDLEVPPHIVLSASVNSLNIADAPNRRVKPPSTLDNNPCGGFRAIARRP